MIIALFGSVFFSVELIALLIWFFVDMVTSRVDVLHAFGFSVKLVVSQVLALSRLKCEIWLYRLDSGTLQNLQNLQKFGYLVITDCLCNAHESVLEL